MAQPEYQVDKGRIRSGFSFHEGREVPPPVNWKATESRGCCGLPKGFPESRTVECPGDGSVAGASCRREGSTVLGYEAAPGGEDRYLSPESDPARVVRLDDECSKAHSSSKPHHRLGKVRIAMEVRAEERRASVSHHEENDSLLLSRREGS